MQPFMIVIMDLPRHGSLPYGQVLPEPGDTLVLNSAVKPFNVGVVVRLPDAGIAVLDLLLSKLLGKPSAKLRSVVGSGCSKRKRLRRLLGESKLHPA